ncbi:cell division protein ZapC domain-containing protein [Testudinibacter sp. P80/BLE/0925]|uniref:cell division protein ZapC domain-containing protein n=1 Tax=Testudinibacter sp. TW-1 TaxID=3417757 RepID=UPI003D368C36
MMNTHGFFYWEYDKAADCLTLCSDTTQRKIRTALKGEVLTQSAFISCDCEADEFMFYTQIMELLEYCDLVAPEKREFLAYTAVAARTFLLPTQPKSWFFEAMDNAATALPEECPYLVQTRVKQNQRIISLLLLASDGNVADCLLLEDELSLPGLCLQFGQPLRIFNNRLQHLAASEHSTSFWQQQIA